MTNALIIGGTGMLGGATEWLTEHVDHTTVIARNQTKFQRLQEKLAHPEKLTFLPINYQNNELLKNHIQEMIVKNGPISIVVSWIHSTAPEALPTIITTIDSLQTKRWSLYHVTGSSADLSKIKQRLTVPETCDYLQVQLGFIIEQNRSRWLTHQEISNGVIEAIKHKNKVTVVGTLEPWEQRP